MLSVHNAKTIKEEGKVRSAIENEAAISMISLGLLAARLELSLIEMKQKGGIFQGDKGILEHWSQILNSTITVLKSPNEEQSGPTARQSPRFLVRAPYLEPLLEAAPTSSKKGSKQLSSYLEKAYDNIVTLKDGNKLAPRQQDYLINFIKPITEACVVESSKFKQEPHPKWQTTSKVAAE